MHRFAKGVAVLVLTVVVVGCAGSSPTSPSRPNGIGTSALPAGDGESGDWGTLSHERFHFSGTDRGFITTAGMRHETLRQMGRRCHDRCSHPGVKALAKLIMEENATDLDYLRSIDPTAVGSTINIAAAQQANITALFGFFTTGINMDRAFIARVITELDGFATQLSGWVPITGNQSLRGFFADNAGRMRVYSRRAQELAPQVNPTL